MKKKDLKAKVDAKLEQNQQELTETQEAILIMYNTLNNGQRKQIVKDEKVKALFERHNISTESED